MSIPICAGVLSTNAKPEIVRPTANFPPSIWGDRFINYDSQDITTHARNKQEIDELKEVVRSEVFKTMASDFSHQLKLIDAIQRLGVAYHFASEIEETLKRMHGTFNDHEDVGGDLHIVALGFRLLRQHGYNVSCDIFNKFKDANGKFKGCLTADIPGMLSLYEAAHLGVRGEDILDEALVFTTTHLESASTTNVSYQLTEQTTQALERPLQKDLERVCARCYMSIYQDEAAHNEALLKLAKLDFNLVQSLHKKELSEITRWWKDLDFEKKLPFARDRIVELYLWIVGVYFEPQYVRARKFLTKVIALVSVMDDIYDAYATFEELEIFTGAIERWDMNCLDELPDYMQIFYHTLLSVIYEIEEEMVKEGRSYRVYYTKESLKGIARAYLEEAKWLNEGYTPTMEEYLPVAIVSTGYPMLSTVSLVGMGDIVTKETFEWLFNDAKIVRASTTLFRFIDDMVTTKFEKERGHVASSVDCYMKQYGVSEQETIEVFNKQVVNLWKDINEEFHRPTAVPMPVLMRVLNLTRVVDLLYKGEDGYTHVGKVVKDIIAALFVDPVPII
ncbi:(-)-alpha-pinene synthase-like [Pyrus x bretschneideri]|uniref:(-)-alpha-pinene synthase-like n=1 Tax=Pyrus x bretschneideri TaxID=225117 RepID=UPI000511603F|nr:(-)-alpha-pinene synthase-like [Pyrus x bretschneideri]